MFVMFVILKNKLYSEIETDTGCNSDYKFRQHGKKWYLIYWLFAVKHLFLH